MVRVWPVVVGAALASCAPAGEPPRRVAEADAAAGTVTVTGVLTDEGVECQALRGDDGALYTIAGGLEGFETGDRVRIVGEVAEMSFCMQGTTLGVQGVEPVS